MSHKITLEEEKEVGKLYAYRSQASIRKRRGHGTTQIARILQPKNLANLLYHEMQDHSLTKWANKHLQEKLRESKFNEKILLFWLLITSLWLLVLASI